MNADPVPDQPVPDQPVLDNGVLDNGVLDNGEPDQSANLNQRMYRFIGGFTVFVVVAAVVSGFLFNVPYVALMPGSARDTEGLVEIEGTEAFPSDGELLFTTVRLRQRPNFWEYLWYQMDDDIELVEEEIILGDNTPDENKEINLQLMTDSKDLAIAVALEQLGYEAIQENGAIVVEVVADAAADGIVEPGDIVLALDGQALNSAEELVAMLGDYAPGDTIVLQVERQNEIESSTQENSTQENSTEEGSTVLDLELTLGAKPDDPDAAFIGIAPQTLLTLDEPPVDFSIEIDSGSVGGPSAGLAFTLAILDSLTPGDLTGGNDVAVTGTISASGGVGSVGGVPQKAAAVREMGVETFIVPLALGEDLIAEVQETAGDSVEVIPVANLTEALEVLESLGGDIDSLAEFAAGS